MLRIGLEISHFDDHAVRCAGAVSADLSADHPPGCVKGSAGDISKVVRILLIVAIEDRSQIGMSLIRLGIAAKG